MRTTLLKIQKYLTWMTLAGLLFAQPMAAQDRNTSDGQQAEANDTTNQDSTAMGDTGQGRDRPSGPPLISIGKDVVLKEGQIVDALVVINGSAKIRGKVRGPAIAVGGDLDIEGEVDDNAVAVLGNINAHSKAKVRENAISVGGKVEVEEGAKVSPQSILLPDLRWLWKYLTHCVLLMRPLAPEVGWIWIVAGIWFLLYLLVAALFPSPIEACVNELRRRPASTFLIGMLTKLLLPLALLILGVTGVGLVVIPFLVAALILGAIIGRIALAEWIGFKLGRNFGGGLQKPVVAFILGTGVVVILYMVPVLGFLTMLVVSVWGLGCAVTAAFGGLRREMPEKPAASPVYFPTPATAMAGAPAMSFAGSPGLGMAGSPLAAGPAGAPMTGMGPADQNPPMLPEVLSFPRASFWERMGAGFLDFVLLGLLSGFVGHMPVAMLIALAYFSGMWAWKGTTVGGIVLGLKVVRLDGQAVTFPVALVRGLAAGFSIVVLFLGFLWIAWDREKQGWHDRIAGTVVLRLPRGTPLLCL